MKSQNTIQHNLVGNLFCLGSGGLFTVWLSAYFGRLPILVSFTSMALATAAWCAAATSFNSYMAARILNGFFSIVAQAVSTTFEYDVRMLSCATRAVLCLFRTFSSSTNIRKSSSQTVVPAAVSDVMSV